MRRKHLNIVQATNLARHKVPKLDTQRAKRQGLKSRGGGVLGGCTPVFLSELKTWLFTKSFPP